MSARGDVLVRLQGVTRVHGEGERAVRALGPVDLEVEAGELVAIMGPSGSGKTTLLQIAGALDRPTEGRVLVAGSDPTQLSAAERAALLRNALGFVFQDLNLLPGLTAAENVALPLELDGTSVRAAREAGGRALAAVGLEHLSDRFPDDLSGGEQQRGAIARAVVGTRRQKHPDEPTG
ncbi:MAG: ATP-binding cassette domain-containing protein, partial [Planctomycetota bacterium]